MKRALIDVSSVIWSCLLAGKDKEYGREVLSEAGKLVWVNSVDYGFDTCLNHLDTVMKDLGVVPRQMIFVVEGANAKAERQFLLKTYKAGRDKVPEQYEAFNGVKEKLLKTFLDLGAQSVTQDGGVEADDVLGYLAMNLDGERWIVSADKDLAQVVGGNVHHYRMGQEDKNPFGPFDHKFIPVYIALVGDASDKIPGAKGFGEKAFLDLLAAFGEDGLELMENLIRKRRLEDLEEDVGELKSLQKIIDDRDNVYLSYELGRLRLEKINTLRRPLKWKAGMVKPRDQIEEQTLRQFGGTVTLVSAENFADALDFFKKHVPSSPEFSLDIETSTPSQSDEWLERLGKDENRTPVDVFGSELTGMSITFGRNMQHTFYMTVDHLPEEGVTNLSIDQVVEVLDCIPKGRHIVVHNAAFELPVCFMAFGEHWKQDPEYHGFLRNVIDTRIMSSYVNENRSAGLKSLSSNVLGYEQETYGEVTTLTMLEPEYQGRCRLGPSGRVVASHEIEPEEHENGAVEPGYTLLKVQYKMNQLTARHVLSYGADDTICTAALSNHFRTIMELEETWDTFMAVEQFPAYVTAKAFVDGVDFSLEAMREMEKDDDVAYDKAWAVLRECLISIGFDGVHPPVFDEINAASIKEACVIVVGQELKTQVRTPSKLAKLIREQWEDDDKAAVLASVIEGGAVAGFNELVARNFDGEPKLDLASPKQMTRLLYDHMKLPVNIINDCTALEKKNNRDLAGAVSRFKKKRAGHEVTLNDKEMALVRQKAKSDDTAIAFALAFDSEHISQEARAALEAIGVMKSVMTRRSLFYKNYWVAPHWKDGKIHAQINQCAAVTRRYSASNPNLQQLPKKGEGVRFRGCFLPHKKNAIVCSIDFVGQELRLAAERSQDRNMLACYIGDNLKDIHSITASGAMQLKWGRETVKALSAKYGEGLPEYDLFLRLRDLDKSDPNKKMADDLRKDSKNVNFAAQFGGKAAKLSETLIMPLEDAQLFLDARSAMFPDVDKAAETAEKFCKKTGYALTMMGARRHLQEAILSDDKWEASRAARQAWNMEIQGSAAEMAKLALSRLWKSGALFRYDVRFIAPIHDEFVTSVVIDDALPFIKEKHAAMTGPYADMRVPILGSISIGKNFADQVECGDEYDPGKIQAVMFDMFPQQEAA